MIDDFSLRTTSRFRIFFCFLSSFRERIAYVIPDDDITFSIFDSSIYVFFICLSNKKSFQYILGSNGIKQKFNKNIPKSEEMEKVFTEKNRFLEKTNL